MRTIPNCFRQHCLDTRRGLYGAEKDTDGLLATANNGYLFLDEVHRLSKENQEKLFLFIDTGNYRPVGENVNWHSAKVRFIFATTEKGKIIY